MSPWQLAVQNSNSKMVGWPDWAWNPARCELPGEISHWDLVSFLMLSLLYQDSALGKSIPLVGG